MQYYDIIPPAHPIPTPVICYQTGPTIVCPTPIYPSSQPLITATPPETLLGDMLALFNVAFPLMIIIMSVHYLCAFLYNIFNTDYNTTLGQWIWRKVSGPFRRKTDYYNAQGKRMSVEEYNAVLDDANTRKSSPFLNYTSPSDIIPTEYPDTDEGQPTKRI